MHPCGNGAECHGAVTAHRSRRRLEKPTAKKSTYRDTGVNAEEADAVLRGATATKIRLTTVTRYPLQGVRIYGGAAFAIVKSKRSEIDPLSRRKLVGSD